MDKNIKKDSNCYKNISGRENSLVASLSYRSRYTLTQGSWVFNYQISALSLSDGDGKVCIS